MRQKPAGDMRRKYTRSKSSSKYISKLCTQTTYAQRLKVKFLMFKYIAASSFPLVDNLHKNIKGFKILIQESHPHLFPEDSKHQM